MSATFSANKGSLLSLKVRNKCGFKPCFFQMHGLKPHLLRPFKLSNDPLFAEKVADIEPCFFQMRLTDASLRPAAAAILRVLQWVASLGFCWVVMRTICCTRLAEICGFRPGRGASFSMLDNPWRIKRLRQRATVWRFTANSAPILRSDHPAAASKIIFERWAKRRLTLRARACFSNCR